ncbi:Pc20g04510 [Penicillium rubens Wisconsin 54-1255]|uniref:Pc20g04510 protein n=1 Tax=Penicillium rubens (strain ATCC 28089 / DSM 1075 / NRRL 1951 / Wisconsin 54-1255) TaxID=500485 RepID=B6HDS5_PENRW|nr:Pc20g04510 [Penicillium rubens Wisconsin 54-1255]
MNDKKSKVFRKEGGDYEQGSIGDVVEGVPGTRILIEDTDAEIILLPRPTSSPDDPLNWSWRRKYIAQAIVFIWAFMLGAATLSPAVTYASVMAELGASTSYLNIGAALALLMLGLGNLVFNPLALRFGRRPVYLFSTLISAAAQVVAARAQTKATFIGSRILLGFGAAPFEQLPALTVDDQFFIHQRGLGLSIYTLALTTGSFLGPIATGFVIDSMGWRCPSSFPLQSSPAQLTVQIGVYWFYAIFLFSVAALVFFALEETGFPRRTYQQTDPNETRSSDPPKTYLQKLQLITILPVPTSLYRTATTPILLLTSPIIWWCGIMYGFAVAWLTIMAYESTTIFMTYNFSSSALGLTNIAPLIGACLVIYLGGAGTDRFMVFKARRNAGIMEPETRLYSVFFAGPIMAAGLILYGVGAANEIHWAGPIIGMGMIGSALPISAEVALGYVSECYPSLAGEATAAVIVIRNVIGCGMTGILLVWKGKACRRLGARRYATLVLG